MNYKMACVDQKPLAKWIKYIDNSSYTSFKNGVYDVWFEERAYGKTLCYISHESVDRRELLLDYYSYSESEYYDDAHDDWYYNNFKIPGSKLKKIPIDCEGNNFNHGVIVTDDNILGIAVVLSVV